MSSDCLATLRSFISTATAASATTTPAGQPSTPKEIQLKRENGTLTTEIQEAATIQIGNTSFARSTLTRYKDATKDEFYPLDALYFAYVKRKARHAEYFQECQKLQLKPVSLVQKSDLFGYLKGDIVSSKYVSAVGPSSASTSTSVGTSLWYLLSIDCCSCYRCCSCYGCCCCGCDLLDC